jgi:hypothetical protein
VSVSSGLRVVVGRLRKLLPRSRNADLVANGGEVPLSAGRMGAPGGSVNGIALAVITLPEAKRGFVLLPRRWIVERSISR